MLHLLELCGKTSISVTWGACGFSTFAFLCHLCQITFATFAFTTFAGKGGKGKRFAFTFAKGVAKVHFAFTEAW